MQFLQQPWLLKENIIEVESVEWGTLALETLVYRSPPPTLERGKLKVFAVVIAAFNFTKNIDNCLGTKKVCQNKTTSQQLLSPNNILSNLVKSRRM